MIARWITWQDFSLKRKLYSCFSFLLSNLCATPTPAMMVRHDRVQYREKDRKKENNLKGGRAASPVLGKENQAQVPRVYSTRHGLRTFRKRDFPDMEQASERDQSRLNKSLITWIHKPKKLHIIPSSTSALRTVSYV